MSLYEYECKECGTVEEVMHSIKDDAMTERYCIQCNKVTPCFRIIGCNGGFRLNDSEGWAKTGYDKNVDMVTQFFD